jgi:hypothetical protein
MPSWAWILLAVIVIVIIAGAAFAARSAGQRKRSERLKQHFGPEYERTLTQVGDEKAAEKELAARERQRDKLDIKPLSREHLAEFTERWRAVQAAFVDDPTGAVGDADQLVTEVMRTRGYPVDDFERRAADISVDHPTIVENYRAANHIQQAQAGGIDVGTEQQRQAFVHYRALFDRLLEPEPTHDDAELQHDEHVRHEQRGRHQEPTNDKSQEARA